MQSSRTLLPGRISELPDQHLIDAALGGVEEAYSELVHRYEDRLLTAIRSDPSCCESADDIVQEAFIRAFRKLKSFRSESSFYTWLYRIALNSRRSYLRDRQRMVQVDFAVETEGVRWGEPLASPVDFVEGREERDQVRAAMARLDDHHRAILVLREFEGFDYLAISKALDVTLGTVRSRLSRARAQLRKELTPYWNCLPKGRRSEAGEQTWSASSLSLTA